LLLLLLSLRIAIASAHAPPFAFALALGIVWPRQQHSRPVGTTMPLPSGAAGMLGLGKTLELPAEGMRNANAFLLVE